MAEFDPNEILKQVINRAFLLRVGEQTIAIIQERTLRGEFLEGSTTQGYSTKTAYMPYPALEERVGKSVWARVKNKQDGLMWSYIGKNRKWVKVEGGYKRLREITGRETDRVDLNWRGGAGMMHAFAKPVIDEINNTIVIKFSNTEAGTLAYYHTIGAGKNRIRRIFMGLTQPEITAILNA